MAANETDNQNKPARPSWETAAPAARPAAPRPMPRPATPSVPVLSAFSPPLAADTPPISSEPISSEPISPEPISPEPLSESDVQYDLAGNPIVRSAPLPSPAPYAPPAPFGYSPGPAVPAPGVWPPPLAGGPQSYRNNSGEQSHLPPEIERLRWNWGAFFFPTMWCRKHGLTTAARALRYGFLVIVLLRMVFQTINPLVFLLLGLLYGAAYWALRIYFGLHGHSIGWRNRHFPGGLEEYHKVQNAWMWWGVGINAFSIVLLPLIAVVLAAQLGLSHPHRNQHYSSSSYSSGSPVDRSGSADGSGQ